MEIYVSVFSTLPQKVFPEVIASFYVLMKHIMNIFYLSKTVAFILLFIPISSQLHAQIFSEQSLNGTNGGQNTIVVKSVDLDNDNDIDLSLIHI